jgi:hypothetical protein
MNCIRRDIFLQIEPMPDYSPLAPSVCAALWSRLSAERGPRTGPHFVGRNPPDTRRHDKVMPVDPATGTQHVVPAENHLQAPVDIAVDSDGKILVFDLVGDKLIRIEPGSGAQTVIAQGGLLASIRSVAVVG